MLRNEGWYVSGRVCGVSPTGVVSAINEWGFDAEPQLHFLLLSDA